MDESILKIYLEDINNKLDRIEKRISLDHDDLIKQGSKVDALHARLDALEVSAKKLDWRTIGAALGVGGVSGGSLGQLLANLFGK